MLLTEFAEELFARTIREEGYEEGQIEGRRKREGRVNRLNQRLIRENRTGDLERAARDREFQKPLYQRYGLSTDFSAAGFPGRNKRTERSSEMSLNIQQLEKALQIRYVKLHFGLRMTEDTWLPMNKVSAIRGGIGEMLLRANCIRDRQCGSCDFESECIVRRTLYSRFDEKPDFVTSGDSVGYVLECENYEKNFYEGDLLEFHLILFGKTIVYFSQFLQAVYQLGMAGIGKARAKYEIIAVRNTVGRDMLRGSEILMERYVVKTLWDYVRYRQGGFDGRAFPDRIRFRTPVTLKHQGKIQRTLSPEAVIPALCRRIYMLDCFEGLNCEMLKWEGSSPKVLSEFSEPVSVCRYSSTQDQKMPLRGIRGEMRLERIPEELIPLLLAGELTHIGKNTSFGFGRYRLS